MPTVVGTQGFRNDVVPGGWNSTPRSRWYLPGPNRTESLQAAPWQKNPLVASPFGVFEKAERRKFYMTWTYKKHKCLFLLFFLGVKFHHGVKNQGPLWLDVTWKYPCRVKFHSWKAIVAQILPFLAMATVNGTSKVLGFWVWGCLFFWKLILNLNLY